VYQCQIADDNYAGCTENYVWVKQVVQVSVSAYVALRFKFSKALTARGIWARLNNKSNIA